MSKIFELQSTKTKQNKLVTYIFVFESRSVFVLNSEVRYMIKWISCDGLKICFQYVSLCCSIIVLLPVCSYYFTYLF